MSREIGQRRRASSTTSAHGAADEQNEDAARVSDEQALDALRTLRRWLGLGGAQASTYDADRLPPGVTRDGYHRRHRARMREGIEGWTRVGQARLVSASAWALEVARETQRARTRSTTAAPVASNDVVDELDAALGIKSRRAAR